MRYYFQRACDLSVGAAISSAISIAFLSLFAGCVYQNDDDFFIHPVTPPNVSDASIILQDHRKLANIIQPVQFSFQVMPLGKGEYRARISVGNYSQELYPSSSGQFFFVIDPAIVGQGEKLLTIEAEYPSLSKSLAGQIGAEIVIVTAKWSAFINTTRPDPVPAPTVYVEDGRSMISWIPPTSDTYLQLIVFREYIDYGNNSTFRDSLKVEDRNATTFHDASYVGGRVLYRVDLKGYGFYQYGETTEFNIDPLKFSFDALANPPVLTWEKSPLYNNDIRLTDILGSVYPPMNAPGSMTTAPINFGTIYLRWLKIVANHPPSQYGYPYENDVYVPLYSGERIDPFQSIAFLPSESAYLVADNAVLRKLDSELSIIASAQFPEKGRLVVSPNGQFGYLVSQEAIYEINMSNGSYKRRVDINGILSNSFVVIFGTPSLSNSNIMTFSVNYWANPRDYALDLNVDEILWSQNKATYPIISADGNLIYSMGKLLKNVSGSWTQLPGTITVADPYSIPAADFHEMNGTQYLFCHNNPTLQIFDMENPTIVDGNYVPAKSLEQSFTKLDRNTNTIFHYNNATGVARILDLMNDFQEERSMKVDNPDNAFWINGHFFHGLGLYVP